MKDSVKAAYWWHKAANQGIVEAQFNLGTCYEKGNGVTKDLSEAVKWYKMAAKQGDRDAQKKLKKLGETW